MVNLAIELNCFFLLFSLDSKNLQLQSKKDELRAELEDLIASQCIFCGDVMIRLIDKPFIEDSEFEAVNSEWL